MSENGGLLGRWLWSEWDAPSHPETLSLCEREDLSSKRMPRSERPRGAEFREERTEIMRRCEYGLESLKMR